MLCCMRRTKQVEKNEDADQKIEQDGNKPEDKAHKAATKIQASFRGHIIRKKLKVDKKDDNSDEAVENHKDGATKTEKEAPKTEEPTADGPLGDKKEAVSSPVGDKKPEPSSEKNQDPPSEEKQAPAETESTTKGSTENSPGGEATQAKEEPKKADVPEATQDAASEQEQGKAESSQEDIKKDEVEETKPSESAQQDEAVSEEAKPDQENA
ncbi:hypothetical protein XENTR_v10004721 [Xenopus tropicalis]|uniref:Neuromodulin n=1 Tax=Xenopus tropicalis TaxID=8364 RepID=K9J896_XENTR|eukprot:NP_001072212.1 neuromodulin [Xenopus tropicalis]